MILILTLFLTSCGLFANVLGVPTDCERYTQDLDFVTSDKILRGMWSGRATGLSTPGDAPTLVLDLVASPVDASHYDVEGTFELEGEPPAEIHGTVSGGCAERYRGAATGGVAQSADGDLAPGSLPPSASLEAEVRDPGGTLLWRVRASGRPYAEPLVHEGILVVEIASATGGDAQGEATLERVVEP